MYAPCTVQGANAKRRTASNTQPTHSTDTTEPKQNLKNPLLRGTHTTIINGIVSRCRPEHPLKQATPKLHQQPRHSSKPLLTRRLTRQNSFFSFLAACFPAALCRVPASSPRLAASTGADCHGIITTTGVNRQRSRIVTRRPTCGRQHLPVRHHHRPVDGQ